MSRLDDLRSAGFSDQEVGQYAATRRQDLIGGGFSPEEADAYLGTTPNGQGAQRTFAQALTDRINRTNAAPNPTPSLTEMPKVMAGQVEAGLNLLSGMVAGAPAYLMGAASGLSQRYLYGHNVDPAEWAKTFQEAVTYQPRTDIGQQFAQTLATPFSALSGAAETGGHKVTDVAMKAGVPDTGAAALGAITDSAIQVLPTLLLGELARRMGGQTVTPSDFQNAAKVIAGADATPETVATVDHSLRASYEKAGIGPFTLAEEAWENEGGHVRDPQLRAELLDPNVELPSAVRDVLPEKAEPPAPTPGNGLPLLESSRDEVLAPPEETWEGEGGRPAPEAQAPGEVQPPTGNEGTQLNAGLAGLSDVARRFAGEYTPYVGVAEPEVPVRPPGTETSPGGGNRSPLVDSLLKVFAPAARGPIAEAQAGIMRANFGTMAREAEMGMASLKDIAAEFDKLSVPENVKFIDDMEHGTAGAGPHAFEGEALRDFLDGLRAQVQGLGKGKLEQFDENYFPHIWQDPEAAMGIYGRRPLEGSKGFLKARTIPFFQDGLNWRAYTPEGDFVASFKTEAEAKAAAGTEGRVGPPLKPVTTNPVELALLKGTEMRRFITGQRIFEEMKSQGLAKFVGFGDRAPLGWTRINDSIARVLQPNEGGGMILRGEYYAPDEAATLLNNHLSPGLQGIGVFDTIRKASNMMNAMQLGLSLFHVGFTTMDSMISKTALGVTQLSRGDIAQGVGNIFQGSNPAQPVVNLIKGDRLLRAYMGNLDDPNLAPIVDAIQQAGGRVKMDDFYRNEAVNTFKQALRNNDLWGATKAFLPTVLDRMQAPVMEWLVPRQKLGVFFDMAKDWRAQNPGASVAEQRAGLGKLWDSVDNRMGQLVYDNLFWNRTLKDALMVSVRSVGWNLGTFRELGGGAADLAKNGLLSGGLSPRSAYAIALPFQAAVYGSLLYYAYNGKAPETFKDMIFPRTGRLRPDGTEDRVALPTYMKDVYAYGEDVSNFAQYGGDPTQTIKNKMNPMVATVSEMFNNEDYFGGAIRNPADPGVQQVAQEAAFLVDQLQPFSLRNYQQQAQAKGEEPSFLGYLTSPSMVGVTPAPGYIVKTPEEKESAAVSKLHDPLVQRFREQIKGGKDIDTLVPEMLKSGMSRQDIKRIIETSGPTPKPHRLKSFGKDDEDTAATAAPADAPPD